MRVPAPTRTSTGGQLAGLNFVAGAAAEASAGASSEPENRARKRLVIDGVASVDVPGPAPPPKEEHAITRTPTAMSAATAKHRPQGLSTVSARMPSTRIAALWPSAPL